jgi:hypothetical protein
MPSLGHDVRLALRRLPLAPGFTIFAVLPLGIGVTTVVYSSVRTLMWPPLAAIDPMASRVDPNIALRDL